MQITDIKQQVKRSQRVSIFIDGRYRFSLTAEEAARHGLKTGQTLSSKDIEQFSSLSKQQLLHEKVLKWALLRPHSEKEIDQYLARKSTDPEVISEAKKLLKRHGFIDDKKFTKAFVDSRRRRGQSAYQIRGELFKRGVDKEIIDQFLADGDSEKAALYKLINKKQPLSRYQDKRKFIAYLVSKGFNYGDVKAALEDSRASD